MPLGGVEKKRGKHFHSKDELWFHHKKVDIHFVNEITKEWSQQADVWINNKLKLLEKLIFGTVIWRSLFTWEKNGVKFQQHKRWHSKSDKVIFVKESLLLLNMPHISYASHLLCLLFLGNAVQVFVIQPKQKKKVY